MKTKSDIKKNNRNKAMAPPVHKLICSIIIYCCNRYLNWRHILRYLYIASPIR